MTALLVNTLLLAVALWVLAVVWRILQEGPTFPGPSKPAERPFLRVVK